MKILVVDDSAMMRGMIRKAIGDNSDGTFIIFMEAANGEDALKIMNREKMDLIFLDWNMPVLDGLSFTKKLRNEGNATPVVMVTSVTDEQSILEAVSSGVDAYVEKPIRGSVLWEQIKEFIK